MMPDFSPAMLRVFLRIRVAYAGIRAASHEARGPAEKAAKTALRKAARVTNTEFHMAWMGWLLTPETRSRLWGALGIVPADSGVRLTHGGQEPHEQGEA